jgi:cytochrome c oxidase subunit 2
MSQNTRRDLIRLGILWVVFAILAEAVTAYGINHYPTVASKQGIVTSEAIFFLLWVTVPILVLVALIVVYSAFRFRVSDDDGQASDKQYRSGRAFPWTWLAASIALNALFIVHPGLTGLSALWSMANAATNATEVDVTAKQWEWRFAYPKQNLEDEEALVVPVNVPIRFVLHSKDVIHSFWVPAWGIKKDVIPGVTRTLVVTPDKIGDTKIDPLMRVQCSQICGVGHAEMEANLRVVSQADFEKWAAAERKAQEEEGGMGGMNMPGMGGMKMNMPNMKPGAPAGKAPMKMNMQGQQGGMNMQNSKPSGMSPSMNMKGSGSMNMQNGNSSGMSPSMNMKGSGSMNMPNGNSSGMSPSMNMKGSGSMNMPNGNSSGMSPSMNEKGSGSMNMPNGNSSGMSPSMNEKGSGSMNMPNGNSSGMSPSMNMKGSGSMNMQNGKPSGMAPSMDMNKNMNDSNSGGAVPSTTMSMPNGSGTMQGGMSK